jgi:hypothetical protein
MHPPHEFDEVFGAEGAAERKIIEADEIRVGPLVIVRTGDGGAGIWIGDGKRKACVAIFNVPGQEGVGLYAKGSPGPCNVCLGVDPTDGSGFIQFARGQEAVYLTFEMIKRLAELLSKEATP